MYDVHARARDLGPLRPLKSPHKPGPGSYPVYPGLTDTLVKATVHPDPDNVIPHVMATCCGYAYAGFQQQADPQTVSGIMHRLGLEDNHCRALEQRVDAMFITAGAYLVQSKDRRVVILCYRGTQPEDVISLLTDADVAPEQISVELDGSRYGVHAGFYRNMRAVRYAVVEALRRALEGKSVIAPTPGKPEEPSGGEGRLEALYITGHSLGGAMAALMAVALVGTPEYKEIAKKLKAVYTFGQPMVGGPDFAAACERYEFQGEQDKKFLGETLIRYIYDSDVVPHLPPQAIDEYAPFGREFHFCKELNPVDWAWSVGADMADAAISFPGDAVEFARDTATTVKSLATYLATGVNGTPGNPARRLADTVRTTVSDQLCMSPLPLGQKNTWVERKGSLRARQITNMAGLTLVAPAAFLAARFALTRNLSFKYSLEDHLPTHYIHNLASQDVYSEYGDTF